MDVCVVYYSVTGNTKRVAEAIAAAVGCIAQTVAEATITHHVDTLFLGASIYGGDIDPSVKAFIDKTDPALVEQVTLFWTGFEQNWGKAGDILRGLPAQRGFPVSDKSYACRGRFLFWNRKHPNADDIAQAQSFAKAQVSP